MRKFTVLTPVFLLLVVTAPLVATPQAHAFGFGDANGNFLSGLVSTLAQKFGLEESKVQAVVNDYQQQKMKDHFQTMQQKHTERLDQLVKEGKITSEQKTAILNKLQELKNTYGPQTLQNLTPQERKQKMQDMHKELTSWAAAQGIDMQYIQPFSDKGMMRGMHKGMWKNGVTPTP